MTALAFIVLLQADFDRLADRLFAADIETRDAAQQALLLAGEAAAPALLRLAGSGDVDARSRAQSLLDELSSRATSESLRVELDGLHGTDSEGASGTLVATNVGRLPLVLARRGFRVGARIDEGRRAFATVLEESTAFTRLAPGASLRIDFHWRPLLERDLSFRLHLAAQYSFSRAEFAKANPALAASARTALDAFVTGDSVDCVVRVPGRRTIPLRHARAPDVVAALARLYAGAISADEKENAVVFDARGLTARMIEGAIRALDVEP